MLDFDMGKYGVYVWTSYGVTLLGLAGLIAWSLRAHAKRKAAVKALQDAAEAGT
ncbi:hemagglutination activity protein [Asticcacaulis sp. AC460]|uniref:heme exporter protein CcmD n=1 Tax=Asticcacaulis sp. AC460 TaxID=1282360 RepID=UPI0003C3DD90|nr:heme exporter protein CcmD [Asticcacaulis sp. AC460]ESQ86444.1 hemagglutination activity protein [Asticcacaulis sp. AC460]